MAADKLSLLRQASFGERIAEEEMKELGSYFVETDQWRQLIAGNKDIVYGAKGSGKSALYFLLLLKRDELRQRGILIVPAERPTGTPAFKHIASDPPTSEAEFVGLWKLYFLSLLGQVLQEWGVETAQAREVYVALADAKLADPHLNLQDRLGRALKYVRRAARSAGVETGVKLDPTGVPTALTGRIILGAGDPDWREAGFVSIDDLLEAADQALTDLDFQVWIALDRLDGAFATHEELEQNALRALFRAYNDLRSLAQVQLKIFLRTDIWRHITAGGFREASHITRDLTITWERQALVQLVLRRALRNEAICDYYGVQPADVYARVAEQDELLRRMLPDQVDPGKHPATFEWMLSRTQDGTARAAPRELIHLMCSLRASEIKRQEVGQEPPPGEALFDRAVFKEALREVSEVRLNQVLYAEYPNLRPFIERLEGEKTQQTPHTLAALWGVEQNDARMRAQALVDVGFFEERGSKEAPVYWVPFVYRDGLKMVQGEAVGFLRCGRQVIERVAQQVMTEFSVDQDAQMTAPNTGVDHAELYIHFQEPRRAQRDIPTSQRAHDNDESQRVALWFFAAEPRSAMSVYGRAGPVVGVGLKPDLPVKDLREAWHLRLGGGEFRWYEHVDRSLDGYRLVVDVPALNTRSVERVALDLNQRLVRALRAARLLTVS